MYVHVFTQMGHGDGPWPSNSKANGLRKIITQSNGTIGWPLAREFSFKRNFPKNLRSKWNGCKEMGKTFLKTPPAWRQHPGRAADSRGAPSGCGSGSASPRRAAPPAARRAPA